MGETVCEAVDDADDLELAGRADPALDAPLSDLLDGADVVVDFTTPEAAPANVRACLDAGTHAVVGTTGFDLDDLRAAAEDARRDGGTANVLVAPNFAIGAVLMMRFAAEAAQHMPECEIIELHHDRKLDAPSGTAKRTADLVREAGGNVHDPIHSVRLPGLVAHQEVLLGGAGPDALDPPRLARPDVVHAGSAARSPPRRRARAAVHGRARGDPLACPRQ